MLSVAPIKYFPFLQCDKAIEAKEPFPVTCLAWRRSCLDLYWVFGTNHILLYCRFKTKNISKMGLVELIHCWLVASSLLQTTIIVSHFWSIKTLLIDCDNLVLFILPIAVVKPKLFFSHLQDLPQTSMEAPHLHWWEYNLRIRWRV